MGGDVNGKLILLAILTVFILAVAYSPEDDPTPNTGICGQDIPTTHIGCSDYGK
jgi:hypothetical protein